MMKQCGFALLDTDQEVLFCKHGGPCGKRLQFGDCPLMSQKEKEKISESTCAMKIELQDRLDAIEQRLDSIEKRLQPPEGKANNDTSDEMPELHVGDYVEVVGQPFNIFGHPTGMTDRVWRLLYPSGLVALESSGLWYTPCSLRKLSDEEIIAKIGWERKA